MKNKRPIIIVLATAVLLLIPLIAMQFTNEVNWSLADFIVAAGLLLGTGFLCDLILRKVKAVKHQVALCLVCVAALLYVWAELAVGIFS